MTDPNRIAALESRVAWLELLMASADEFIVDRLDRFDAVAARILERLESEDSG